MPTLDPDPGDGATLSPVSVDPAREVFRNASPRFRLVRYFEEMVQLSLKNRCQKFPGARRAVRALRRLARPARFLVWHTPHEPFRSQLIQKALEHPGAPFLDLASGTRRLGPEFLNIDLNPHEQVDVIGDAGQLPFARDTFGLIWFEAVLEHLPDPHQTVSEIGRVLKPGGWLYVEIPFMQGYHADPGDYQRFTMEGLRQLFRSFEIEWVHPCSGPASAFCHSGASFFATLFSFRSKWLYKILFHYVFCYLFYPFKFLDSILIGHPEAHRTAFGYALLARAKNSAPVVTSPVADQTREHPQD